MTEKEQIKTRILEEIESTQGLVAKYRELTKPIAPENAIGRVSRMDAINNKSVNDAALKKAELKLKNLQVALSKIDDTDFGICVRCKNEIPLGRILLMPQAITCVNCAR
ncbi:TraR/DksA C4-type zinc finger protein [Aureisphaera galaxeae]|uniref:TraR/DksA family transcriptional regulator n=1 Tax=Aureisphaera galaxeae TaxID=1538023 RepID=UPI00234FD10C|nr:TraR/DksA C4-type zinc finger protein [Aureisphaera galaxeae]MDC8004129.1 TraR/DksA C4-type zinc finger protein [Aureisphaera galaxeae]